MNTDWKERPKTPEDLANTFADTNRREFELMVLGQCFANKRLWERMGPLLGVSPDGTTREDFGTTHHNLAFRIIKNHRVLDPNFNDMQLNAFEALFRMEVEAGHAVDDDREFTRQVIQQAAQAAQGSEAIVELAFPVWIKRVRLEADKRDLESRRGWSAESLVKLQGMHEQQVMEIYEQQILDQHYTDANRPPHLSGTRYPWRQWIKLCDMMGGGAMKGECYMVAGATGAGKTVFATQAAAQWALDGLKGLVITTEQPPWQLKPRIVSAQLSIPFHNVMDGVDPRVLTPEQRKANALLTMQLHGHLMFKDWSLGMGATITQNLENALEKAHDDMGGLDWFILDWVGGAIPVSDNNDHVRRLMQNAADHSMRMCKKHDLMGVVMAQTHQVKGINQPRVDGSMTADCTSMHKNLTGFIGISGIKVRDAENSDNFVRRQFFNAAKTRMGKGGLVPFAREFEYQRMIEEQR